MLTENTHPGMSDQLSSVGVEFDLNAMSQLFLANLRWAANHPFPFTTSSAAKKPPVPWANAALFPTARLANVRRDNEKDKDKDQETATAKTTNDDDDVSTLWETARPWSLGQTRAPTSLLQKALGESLRRPGLFMRVDEDSNELMTEPLVHTGEAIHSCVRVRLACGGLGMDDEAVWTCPSLTKQDKKKDKDKNKDKEAAEAHLAPVWRLERGSDPTTARGGDDDDDEDAAGNAPFGDTEGFAGQLYPVRPGDGNYQWVYTGQVDVSQDSARDTVPQATSLPEEPLSGPAERLLLALTAGQQDVWRYAENKDQK